MQSARNGYLVVAAVLVGVVVASAAWSFPARSPTVNPTVNTMQAARPEPVAAPVASPNPNYSVTQADQAIAGTAERIAASLGLSSEPITTATRSNICGASPAGWINANEVRAIGPRTSVRINVSAWRAGAASNAFKELAEAAGKCATVRSDPDTDRLVAVNVAGQAQQVVGVVRVGDTLSVVNTATLAGDAEALAWQAVASAEQIVKKQLAGVCLNPTSATEPDNTERDPYSPSYSGAKKSVQLSLPVTRPIDSTVQQSLRQTSTDATWVPPPPIPRNDLAPLAPAGIGGTLTAPWLIDPDMVNPPAGAEPTTEATESPTLPESPTTLATYRIPFEDVVGPGCGWKFADTNVPIFDAAHIAALSQPIQLKALVAATRKQGNWLVATASWPGRYQLWLDSKRSYADWERYREVLDLAKAELELARRRYADSFAAATSSPSPLPSSSPTSPAGPTQSPTPDPDPGVGASGAAPNNGNNP